MTVKRETRLKLFVGYYLGEANGNGRAAAILAGVPAKAAHVWASKALRTGKVKTLMDRRDAKRDKASIATADERDEVLTAILRDKRRKAESRIRAVAELNKATGRHSMTHHLKGRVTLEQLVAGSRRP